MKKSIKSLVGYFFEYRKSLLKTMKHNVPQTVVLDMTRKMLNDALCYKTVEIPSAASGWKMYTGGQESEELAKELHDYMAKVIKCIDSLTIKDVKSHDFKYNFGFFVDQESWKNHNSGQ